MQMSGHVRSYLTLKRQRERSWDALDRNVLRTKLLSSFLLFKYQFCLYVCTVKVFSTCGVSRYWHSLAVATEKGRTWLSDYFSYPLWIRETWRHENALLQLVACMARIGHVVSRCNKKLFRFFYWTALLSDKIIADNRVWKSEMVKFCLAMKNVCCYPIALLEQVFKNVLFGVKTTYFVAFKKKFVGNKSQIVAAVLAPFPITPVWIK